MGTKALLSLIPLVLVLVMDSTTPARSQTSAQGCPLHSSPVREERVGDTIRVICKCDSGYFKGAGQCLTLGRARTESRRSLEFKAIAYKGAVDRVKHTGNAFGFHIDAKGYAALQHLKPKLPYIISSLVLLAIYKNPKTAADLTKEAIGAAVIATTAATVFVTDVVNDCNFRNFETKTLCGNFRMAVLDLQPRIDAFTAAREELAKLY